MSRTDEIYQYRKALLEELKGKVTTDLTISLTLIQANLMEISDTLAFMYDKMCEKEQETQKGT